MSADHLLHLTFDERWGPTWELTCHHELGEYPTYNIDDPDEEPDPECWTQDWWDNLSIDDMVTGSEWPERLCFPLAVRPVWNEGLALVYDAAAEQETPLQRASREVTEQQDAAAEQEPAAWSKYHGAEQQTP